MKSISHQARGNSIAEGFRSTPKPEDELKTFNLKITEKVNTSNARMKELEFE
jgi:hypothetical protein